MKRYLVSVSIVIFILFAIFIGLKHFCNDRFCDAADDVDYRLASNVDLNTSCRTISEDLAREEKSECYNFISERQETPYLARASNNQSDILPVSFTISKHKQKEFNRYHNLISIISKIDIQAYSDSPEIDSFLNQQMDKIMDEQESFLRNLKQKAQNDFDSSMETGVPFYPLSSFWEAYIKRMDSKVISLVISNHCFNGENSIFECQSTYNFDLTNQSLLTLSSIIESDCMSKVIDEIRIAAINRLKMASALTFETDDLQKIESRIQQSIISDSWIFDHNGIIFYCYLDNLEHGLDGCLDVLIPYSKLTGILKSEYFPENSHRSEGELVIIDSPDSVYDLEIRDYEDSPFWEQSICASGTVYDLRIYSVKHWAGQTAPVPGALLFGASCLADNYSIHFFTDTSPNDGYFIVYRSADDKIVTKILNSDGMHPFEFG